MNIQQAREIIDSEKNWGRDLTFETGGIKIECFVSEYGSTGDDLVFKWVDSEWNLDHTIIQIDIKKVKDIVLTKEFSNVTMEIIFKEK